MQLHHADNMKIIICRLIYKSDVRNCECGVEGASPSRRWMKWWVPASSTPVTPPMLKSLWLLYPVPSAPLNLQEGHSEVVPQPPEGFKFQSTLKQQGRADNYLSADCWTTRWSWRVLGPRASSLLSRVSWYPSWKWGDAWSNLVWFVKPVLCRLLHMPTNTWGAISERRKSFL